MAHKGDAEEGGRASLTSIDHSTNVLRNGSFGIRSRSLSLNARGIGAFVPSTEIVERSSMLDLFHSCGTVPLRVTPELWGRLPYEYSLVCAFARPS